MDQVPLPETLASLLRGVFQKGDRLAPFVCRVPERSAPPLTKPARPVKTKGPSALASASPSHVSPCPSPWNFTAPLQEEVGGTWPTEGHLAEGQDVEGRIGVIGDGLPGMLPGAPDLHRGPGRGHRHVHAARAIRRHVHRTRDGEGRRDGGRRRDLEGSEAEGEALHEPGAIALEGDSRTRPGTSRGPPPHA